MEHYVVKPLGVCSRKIAFDIQDGKIYHLEYEGGCNGNLKAIGKLVEGLDINTVIERLDGNICGMKKTSCADQLAQALKKVEQGE